jgi:predicted nucleic acid-binding protein
LILADTSIWIDHFRSSNRVLQDQLLRQRIVMHPFVVGELALGSLPRREKTLKLLDQLPGMRVALLDEVRQVVEARSLHSRGIGWVDAQLIAAVLIHPATKIWTRDKGLREIAEDLHVYVDPA